MPLPNEVLVEVRANLAAAEKALKETDAAIREAFTAGVDVTELQKRAKTLREQIMQMKSVYGAK